MKLRQPDESPTKPPDDEGILSTLFYISLELRHPRHHLADEHARRTFFDVGFAALCRNRHPVRQTGEDHLALYQLFDWPRARGRTVAEEVSRALDQGRAERPDFVDPELVRAFSRARLMVVRTTSRAGDWIGFEDRETGRMMRSSVPQSCKVDVGDTILTRFAETRLGYSVPIADFLVIPHEASSDFDDLRNDPDGPRGPDQRSTEAARLFRAWTIVAFGDDAGVIDPVAHCAG